MTTTVLLASIFILSAFGKGLALVGFGALFLYSVVQVVKTPVLRQAWLQAVRSPLALAMVAVLALWLLSSLCGLAVERSVRTWLGLAGLAVAAVTAYPLLRTLTAVDYLKVSRWVSCGLLFGSLIVLVCYSQVSPWFNDLLFDRFTRDGRPIMRVFSTLFAVSLPFAWLYMLKGNKVLGFVVSTTAVAAIVIAAGRSGWVAFAFSAFVFAVLFPWKNSAAVLKNALLYIGQLLLGSSIGYVLLKFFLLPQAFAERMAIATDAGTGLSRVKIWEFALEAAMQHPWLGVGLKAYRHLDFGGERIVKAHPHNMFIEIFLETGTIGLAAFVLLMLALLLKPLWRVACGTAKDDARAIQTAMFASLGAYLVAAQLTTSFFHLWWTTYFAVLVLLVVTVDRSLIKPRPL